MQIISHRGFWLKPEEKNTKLAFERAFSQGFGVETDIRDCQGELVIAHDLAQGDEMSLEEFLSIYKAYDKNLPLAINIKADGLQALLKHHLAQAAVENYFVFDMSIPDGLHYLRQQFNVFTRHSEFEPQPLAFYDAVQGVWLDCFNQDWIDDAVVAQHLTSGKQVCIVSPELHKRDHHLAWKKFKASSWYHDPRVMLCTDYPQEAKVFFHD